MNDVNKNTRKQVFVTTLDINEGSATISARDDESINLEVSLTTKDLTKYEAVGALRYITQAIRTAANEAVKSGKSVLDALDVARKSVVDAMNAGTYAVRTGEGESIDTTTPEAKRDAILNVYLPSKFAEPDLQIYRNKLNRYFDAVTAIDKVRVAKDGTSTTYKTIRRPMFNKFTSHLEVKLFLAKHFETAGTTSVEDLFSADVPDAPM